MALQIYHGRVRGCHKNAMRKWLLFVLSETFVDTVFNDSGMPNMLEEHMLECSQRV